MSRSAVLLAVLLLATGCAAQAGPGAAPGGTSSAEGTAPGPGGNGLVLQVAHTGGYVPPQTTFARLPLVSVYDDGGVITQGPVAAVYPGPALPNVLVARVDPAAVDDLVQRALDAGVGEDADLGMPMVTDLPSTRFTVVTDEGTRVTEVYALEVGALPREPGGSGLTDEQIAARARLQGLLAELTAAGGPVTEPYEPDAVAAVVTEWVDPDDGLAPRTPVPWPGTPLPGEPLDARLGVHCVTARSDAADEVLRAAGSADALTPWTTDGGTSWAVTLRPMLPHETGCADLRPA